MDVDRAALLALDELRRGCASTSCWSAAGGGRSAPCRRCGCASRERARRRGTSATIGSGASSILPLGVRSTSGRRGSQRAEVDAVRRGLEPRERQPVGVGAEAVAVGAGAQHAVEHPLGPGARLERGEQLVRVAARRPAMPACATARCTSSPATKSSSASMSASAPWPGGDRRSAAAGSPTRPAPRRRARTPAASSWRRCGPRAGRARGRSASARAATAAGRITSAWRVVSLT